MKKQNKIVPITNNSVPSLQEREGYFKEGFDKLGRKYEKKIDTNGVTTKVTQLKNGKTNYSITK